MSDDPRRLTTDEERERAHAARRYGGLCAWCGRMLTEREPVYVEQFMGGTRQLVGLNTQPFPVYMLVPVGTECASPDFLAETGGQEPTPCAGCGRGVYYRTVRPNRQRALCSRRCVSRANQAARRARTGEG